MVNHRNSSLFIKSAIASADQALLSALNFLISILLIKTVLQAEYGYYSIAFTVVLFVISIQNATINAPLAVLLAQKKTKEKAHYVSSLCYGQYLAVLPLAGFGILISLIFRFNGSNAIVSAIAVSICLASFGILLREFLRSYFFAEGKAIAVLKLDGYYVLLFLASLGMTYFWFEMSVSKIFYFMGLSALAVGIIYCKDIRLDLRFDRIRASYSENWIYGKWALVGVIVTHLQNYCYLYLLGAIIGSTAVAEVSAARLLLMPLVFVQTGWKKIVIPHGSNLREQKKIDLFFKQLIIVSVVIVLGITGYIVLLMMFSDVLLNYLLSEKYESSFNYLIPWGIIFAIQITLDNACNGLIVLKKFKLLTILNLISMPITIVCAYFLIKSNGIYGGLAALIIGSSIFGIMLWASLARLIYSEKEGFSMEMKKFQHLSITEK